MEGFKMDAKGIIQIIFAVALLAFLIYLFKSFLDSQQEKGAEELASTEALNSSEMETIINSIPKKDLPRVIYEAKKHNVIDIGTMIYDAKGFFDDDEQSVYSAFSMIKNQIHMVHLADYFKRLYKIEIVAYLSTFLNDEEMNRVNDIIKRIPKY